MAPQPSVLGDALLLGFSENSGRDYLDLQVQASNIMSFKMQIWIMDTLNEQQMQNIEIGQFLLLLLCVQTNRLGVLRILPRRFCAQPQHRPDLRQQCYVFERPSYKGMKLRQFFPI
jgi:hypothetical protein